MTSLTDRIHGGLAGAVVGDALGSLTETLSRRQIRELYGWVDDFTEFRFRPFGQVRPVGGWTDDSSLVVAMARSVVDAGRVDLDAAVRRLLAWADDDSVSRYSGPSTSAAVTRLRAGEEPAEVGLGGESTGTSNGGGMKAAPAGWAHPGDVPAAARAAAVLCTPTHNTQLAIAGAAAVAAACAVACRDGASVDDVVAAGVEGARLGEEIGLAQGREVAGPSIARRIDWAAEGAEAARAADGFEQAIDDVADRVGAGLATHESVPAVFGLLVAAEGDVNRVVVAAANVGDDTDTVGTMAGAIAGTLGGAGAVHRPWYDLVTRVNEVDLATLAADFAAALERRR